MTRTTVKRGTSPAKRKGRRTARSGKSRTVGTLDRALRALPVSEGGLQKALTALLVGGVGIAGLAVAEAAGVLAYAEARIAEAASENGYRVRHLVVDGMENVDRTEVYAIIADQKDRSMPLLDLEQVRSDLVALSWVSDARVIRRLPDQLVVEIEERRPTAIWRDEGRNALIDSNGHVLEMVDAGARPDLPRLDGANANRKAVDLARLLDAAPALREQVASAEWVGDRRWNLVFRTGETLKLPEGPAAAQEALLTFARFDGVNRILGRDLISFDMRDPRNMYVRKLGDREATDFAADGEG